jgi:hypothetical protein
MIKKISIATAIVVAAGFAHGQNAVGDIRRVNLFFAQEKISMNLKYNVYADSSTTKAMQSEQGSWIKSGNVQYQRLGMLETIRKSGDIQLMLDHENKVAVVSDAPVMSGDETDIPGLNGMESLLDDCRKIKYRSISAELSAYDLYPATSEFYKVTVEFEKKSFSPKRIVLQYANPIEYSDDDDGRMIRPRIEVQFDAVPKGHQETVPDFAKYLVKNGSTGYELTAAYKEYQLNNYLLTN